MPLFYDRNAVSENSIVSRLMEIQNEPETVDISEPDVFLPEDAETEYTDEMFYEKLDMIYDILCQSVSGNGAEIIYVPVVSENSVTVSVNSIPTGTEAETMETVQNPLITTRLEDYSLTDSLLLLTVLLLLAANALIIFYRRKG